MQEVKDFFSGLFSTAYWPPRWHCGQWSAFHGWLYIISDLAIWSAYFAIPVIIILYISRRKNVRFHPIYFLFAAFILACGITHLLDAITFWYPMYRLNALVRFIAGAISWVTVFYLIKLLPVALTLKTAGELQVEVDRNKVMEQELNMVNVELSDKVRQLENANKELEQFAYISSHDLQEPLRKIQTYLGLMAEHKDDKEQFDKYYTKVFDSSARMKKLITELLAYSRLSDMTQKFQPVDLNQVINGMRYDFELLISEKNATLNASALPVIAGIKTQMTQLFSNLLTNAIKFSDKPPVIDITAELLDNRMLPSFLNADQQYVRIQFKDNGIGFQQEFSDQMFKMFQRLNNKSDYEGTGIGLAICKKIVDNHGGSISATGIPGKGATFEIILPLKRS
jgi:signal transduction histidine kinase